MSVLKLKIIDITGISIQQIIDREQQYNDKHKIVCVTSAGINTYELAKAKQRNSLSTVCWKAHRNKGHTVLFFISIILLLMISFGISCAVLYRLCEEKIECYAYMFPLCFFSLIGAANFILFKLMKSNWVSKVMFSIENHCAFFYTPSENKKKPFTVMIDNDDIKSKAYIDKKAFPITLLHCRAWETYSNIKIAVFHLPKEIRLHQVVGCDVIDYLRLPFSSLHHENIGILVAFYYSEESLSQNDENINDFISFLNKSGLNVVIHKKKFVIVAINNASRCSLQEDESCSFELSLPHSRMPRGAQIGIANGSTPAVDELK